jgi:hypothetical protein
MDTACMHWSPGRITAVAVGVAAALLAGFGGSARAATSYIPGWIMIGSQYQQLVAQGYTGLPPQYLTCEQGGTGPDNGPMNTGAATTCSTTGNTVAFVSEAAFAAWAKDNKGATALLDMESPVDFGTPKAEASNPLPYICDAARTATADHIRLIEASTDGGPAGEQEAARCGAYAVELQYQSWDARPSRYLAKIRGLVTALRKIREHVTIITGIGTDASGIPVSPAFLYDSWKAVRSLVNGYWLNLAHWTVLPDGQPDTDACIPDVAGNTVATGCVATGLDFMQDAGFQPGGS